MDPHVAAVVPAPMTGPPYIIRVAPVIAGTPRVVRPITDLHHEGRSWIHGSVSVTPGPFRSGRHIRPDTSAGADGNGNRQRYIRKPLRHALHLKGGRNGVAGEEYIHTLRDRMSRGVRVHKWEESPSMADLRPAEGVLPAAENGIHRSGLMAVRANEPAVLLLVAYFDGEPAVHQTETLRVCCLRRLAKTFGAIPGEDRARAYAARGALTGAEGFFVSRLIASCNSSTSKGFASIMSTFNAS